MLFSLRFHEHQTFQKPTNSGCGGTRLLFREVVEVTPLGSERGGPSSLFFASVSLSSGSARKKGQGSNSPAQQDKICPTRVSSRFFHFDIKASASRAEVAPIRCVLAEWTVGASLSDAHVSSRGVAGSAKTPPKGAMDAWLAYLRLDTRGISAAPPDGKKTLPTMAHSTSDMFEEVCN